MRLVFQERNGDCLALFVGVSSGLFHITEAREKMELAGLYKKALSSITKGVEFVQVDLESVAEFKEPYLKENMENVKRLGITFGIHSETVATGVEIAEMDSAIETDYKFGHERLMEIIEKSGELGSKYVLIHASESESFISLERHMQPARLVDFFGRPLRKFLEKPELGLLDWALGGKTEELTEKIMKLFLETEIAERKKIKEEEIKNKAMDKCQDFIWRELFHGKSLHDYVRGAIINAISIREDEEKKFYHDMSEEDQRRTNDFVRNRVERLLEDVKRELLDYTQSRSLSYGPERIAYYFIARYMEMTNDPLWKNIIESTVKYWAKSENKTVEEWKKSKNIRDLDLSDPNFILYSYIWVPAVSAKYIWGHLNQDKNDDREIKYPDLKQILKKYGMPLVLETPMGRRGTEQWLRLANPLQMYYLAKEIGSDYVQLAIDLEHMLSVRLDPEKVVDLMPDDAGRFVRVVHAGYPSALAPAHLQIQIGSDQQMYLYKIYYRLWKKGMGRDNDCFLVFERGAPESMQESLISLRKIKEFMEKDIDPNDLINHPEFFGLATGEIASPERQLNIIHHHAWDPIRGLIVIPEEKYTFLGKAAMEKGKRPEEWEKEENR